MRRRDTFFQLCSWKMGLLGMPHRLVTWKHHIIIVEHRCARTRTYYPKNSKTAVKRVVFMTFSLFFLSYLQMECRAMKYFPAHISWTTGREEEKECYQMKPENILRFHFRSVVEPKGFGIETMYFYGWFTSQKSFQCKKLFSLPVATAVHLMHFCLT